MKVLCVLVLVLVVCALLHRGDAICPGVCQDSSDSCGGSYHGGLCPGGSNVECCEESTKCVGQCQDSSILSCSGGQYFSGFCPGSDSVMCCMNPTGTYGVDLDVGGSVSDFQCLKGAGVDFMIVRCYHSYGAPDTNAPIALANAASANITRRDVYMFPCPLCGTSGASQVQDAVSALQDANANFTMFWFDIEGGSQYWSTDISFNQQFFEDMMNEAAKLQIQTGVYTNLNEWTPIMGSSYTGGSKLPLWYAAYQTPPQENFDDYNPFGGWSAPAAKQYAGDAVLCGIDLDLNWVPA